MPIIGAHISASGGLLKSIGKAKAIGADCLQLFISSPLQWAQVPYSVEQEEAFTKALHEASIGPLFFHAIYLINLATENDELLQKSKESLIYYLNHAIPLGSSGVIFHVGSHKGLGFDQAVERVVEAIKEILLASDPQSTLVIENSAGSGGTIGSTFSEIGEIMKRVNSPRLKVCLDTQHSFASGYDWCTKEGYEKALSEFDQLIGLKQLTVIHTNDSKVAFASHRDRHENIGLGLIGDQAFARFLTDPGFASMPFILEVPGIDGHGPDQANIDRLKSLCS